MTTPSSSGIPRGGPPLTEEEAEGLLRCICFKTGPPRAVGAELEWLVHELRDPRRPVPPRRLAAAIDTVRAVPLVAALTFEPGGQLELSSPPAASLMECLDSLAADLRAVREALAPLGLGLSGYGVDPWHAPRERVLHEPRYDAMELVLGRTGPSGRAMMCESASVQVCLDAGLDDDGPLGYRSRWRLAHLLGAVLVAAFANSPVHGGRRTGWRSTRQALWTDLDPTRALAPSPDGEPRAEWAAHVLDTPVMCVRTPSGPWAVPEGLTFRDWLRTGVPRRADADDLHYHLTTLFPPVRPRGHLELRMIDAQPGPDGWMVPVAVTTALFEDPRAAAAAHLAVEPLAALAGDGPAPRNALWRTAARDGLTDPALHKAALTVFEAALDALPRLGASPDVLGAVAAFHARYVVPGGCPADEQLEVAS
ncbi:ergothioneine biosynthesis glutamate--cysteine ligase EgtA [Streptomyces sp. SKN60]|uniref:ergothioneine biosynthesis glutamate--cysteine ligase EgtA n=1 Tax=Streptomyces sp. SKN60 TaxID=2855506 RepID=UPI002245EF68|nr:ergothioneine biosynthesis glutamate--cysteine ligase EgtA [Streptomyces sp. SKN60]MCX2184532.1 ergothioneine biosynthesis glutamate--cysteine ligase EgtA [Streptomyces sp. SKN60]